MLVRLCSSRQVPESGGTKASLCGRSGGNHGGGEGLAGAVAEWQRRRSAARSPWQRVSGGRRPSKSIEEVYSGVMLSVRRCGFAYCACAGFS